jgi:hypothetical protein
MKRILLLLVLIGIPIFGFSQVGINTTSPNAQLDIKSSNQLTPSNTDGILIPKIDAFPLTNPTAAQNSMMVYLTTISAGKQPGFYYWDDGTTSWIGLTGLKGWGLLGNSGTNPTTNFMGTTDDKDVVFKRNNVISGKIATYSTSFGNEALFSNTTGDYNTAIGSQTLYNNTDGHHNMAFGNSALSSNTNGAHNVAFGFSALNQNNNGLYNVAMGSIALSKNVAGISNTAIGAEALREVTGSNNTALGFDAGVNTTTGNNNIAIGANTNVPNIAGNNQMSIGNVIYGADMSTMATGKIGIGVPIPTEKLEVAGKTKTTNFQMTTGAALNSVLISDASGNGTWVSPSTFTSGTLDQAYDFGGAGLGRTITADAGAVTINGTDGLVSTGTYALGVVVPSGAGTRMVWNPRKAAFRAGYVTGTEWDDNNIGDFSTAFGQNTQAIGQASTAFGAGTRAVGFESTAFGLNTQSIGVLSTAFGGYSTANGAFSTAFGSFSQTDGVASTAFGISNTASSYGETVLGIAATTYTPSANGALISNATDRLFVIGNGIDTNSSGTIDPSERSNAMVVLKNGNTGIGNSAPTEKLEVAGKTKTTNIQITNGAATGRILVSDAAGNGTWTTANSIASGTLDQAYDFGGSGVGRTITADAGAVTIGGTDGLLCTGTYLTGAAPPTGNGIRMFWYPKKAAFRTGGASTTEWDDANIGFLSIGMGWGTKASGGSAVALGSLTTASGDHSTAMGASCTASGLESTAFGWSCTASGERSTAFGLGNWAQGVSSVSINFNNKSSGYSSLTAGSGNIAYSFGETVLGLGATTYTTSVNGDTQFGAVNSTDRLFVVGNAIDANGNGSVDTAERSDALVILKNGNTGIGTSAPALARLQVQGAVGNTVAMFSGSANSQGVSVVSDWPGIYFNSYYSGGTRAMSASGFTSIINTDQSTGGLIFQTTNVVNPAAGSIVASIPTRMTITGTGRVGIGTPAPGGQFELSLDDARKPGGGMWTIPSDERLKTIHGNYSKGLQEILKLQPITYNYKNTGKRTFEEKVLQKEFSGFSAQAVQKIFPEAVGVDDDGFLNLNMHPILVAFVNAFKEIDLKDKVLQIQVEQIKTQQEEINSLKAINTEILKRLEKLENK